LSGGSIVRKRPSGGGAEDQAGGGAGLGEGGGLRERGAAGDVVATLRRQPLQGDIAPEAGVGRAKHLAHPAGAERRDDAVGAELITRGQAQGHAPIEMR
jgi:hypothetical protein